MSAGSKGIPGVWKARTGKKGVETMMTELDLLKELTICSVDELRDEEIRIHRIHRNHHSREDSDGVSRHRLVPISPTFYMSRFQMITGFRLRLN